MRQISAWELNQYLRKATRLPLLLDVREPWEFQHCHIEGAQLMPMGDVRSVAHELDSGRETVVICHHGIRSFSVARFLENELGFTNIVNLTGGVAAWARDVEGHANLLTLCHGVHKPEGFYMKYPCPASYLALIIPLLAGIPAAGAEPLPGTADAAALAAPRTGAADTLTDIYELALHNDHTLAAARATYSAGLEDKNLGLAQILPRVNASGGYSITDTESRGSFPAGGVLFPNSTDTTIDNITWAISLDQPVFDLAAWFRFQRGTELSKQAEAIFAVAQQDLIVRSAEAYFQVLRNEANLHASRAQETALRAQLDQAKQRFEVGLSAITDMHDAQAAYDLAIAERLTDEGNLGSSLEQLSVLTGQQHRNLWRLRDEYPVSDPQPAEADAWARFAVDNNYDIKAAALNRNVAHEAARAARAEHLPKLNLSLNYQNSRNSLDQDNLVTGITRKFPSDQKSGSVGLNLNMPLFAGGAISANSRQSFQQFSAASEDYAGTVRAVTQQARALYITVISDTARARARAQAIVSTRSALEASEIGYEVGTRDIVDVLAAQRTFFSAVRDYANSRIDHVLDTLRLKRQAGTLSPADIYDLNRWLDIPAAE